jgi:chromosome partitioning protein
MIIAVTNLKGGVGKTTIAQNLAVCLSHMGQSVCLIDTDTNKNSQAWAGIRPDTLPNVAISASTEPATISKAITDMHKHYDIIVVDGTPSLSQMTTRIIMSCDMLIVPTLASPHDFRAMPDFITRIDEARQFKDSIPAYLLLNQFDPKVKVQQTAKEAFREYGLPILDSTLAKRTVYMEAGLNGMGVIECADPKAKDEFSALVNEIIEKAQEHQLITA